MDSPHTHARWQQDELENMVEGGIPWPMLSDAGGQIGTDYGVYDDEAGAHVRGRFLIDPDGVLQSMEIMAATVGRNVEEVMRQVKAFQHVRDTGEVTPDGWEPGEPGLEPGYDLVGNVWKVWLPKGANGGE